MMVKVYLLPADEGDYIWLRYGDDESYSNIIIDGGTKNSGEEYAEVIKFIEKRKEKIEALILTHIDYDHLQGAVEGIHKLPSDVLKNVVKRILFNTCRGILRKQGQNECAGIYAEDQVKSQAALQGYAIGDAITFMELLKEKGLLDCLVDYVVSGTELTWAKGASIKIISPGKDELNRFLGACEPYCKERGISFYSTNIELAQSNLEKLQKERLGSDPSPNNASAIAFLFEYEDVKIAFLADAKPTTCICGLNKLGIKTPYGVDLLKISHHGSKNNMSDALLRSLETNVYMLSTNGNKQKVPNKVVIAHLLKKAKGQKVQLLCNYEWWDTMYHGDYFTRKDAEKYFDTNLLELYSLDENGIEVKDGLKIYGERGES